MNFPRNGSAERETKMHGAGLRAAGNTVREWDAIPCVTDVAGELPVSGLFSRLSQPFLLCWPLPGLFPGLLAPLSCPLLLTLAKEWRFHGTGNLTVKTLLGYGCLSILDISVTSHCTRMPLP